MCSVSDDESSNCLDRIYIRISRAVSRVPLEEFADKFL